jgi:hypothetical protein
MMMMARIETSVPAAKITTPSYVELSSQAYALIVDAYAAASRRQLDYMKSVYEIVSRPYGSTAIEQTVRENFDRVSQIISLSIAEMQNSGQKTAEFSEKWLNHTLKAQDSAFEAARGLVKTGISNLELVKESTNAQLDTLTKRVEEAQNRVVTSAAN